MGEMCALSDFKNINGNLVFCSFPPKHKQKVEKKVWKPTFFSVGCSMSNVFHISIILPNKYVLSTMGVSKESISKFLIGNRFHVKLRILSPYSNRIKQRRGHLSIQTFLCHDSFPLQVERDILVETIENPYIAIVIVASLALFFPALIWARLRDNKEKLMVGLNVE